MKSRLKLTSAAIVLITLASLGIANASLTSSGSSSVIPFDATGCSSNICIYLSTPSSGTVYVQGWARSTSFYGALVVTTPTISATSPIQNWLGSKGNYFQVNGISAIVGQYCVAGYTSGGTFEGKACESVL